jgi:hypothetical protein
VRFTAWPPPSAGARKETALWISYEASRVRYRSYGGEAERSLEGMARSILIMRHQAWPGA